MEKYTSITGFSLKPSQKDDLNKYCTKKGKQVSALIREFLIAKKIIKP